MIDGHTVIEVNFNFSP